MSNRVEEFLQVFSLISKDNLHLLHDIYADNVTFIDPIHTVEGIDNLHTYFKNMYENIGSCHFEFENIIQQADTASITWVLYFTHPRLNKCKQIAVPGSSFLRFADKVVYHRDYFDVGSMLYEHIPLLGTGIQFIKSKLNS